MKILYENKHTNEGLTKAERHNRMLDKAFDYKKQTDRKMMDFLKTNSELSDEEIQDAYNKDNLGGVLKDLGLHNKFWGKNESLEESYTKVDTIECGVDTYRVVGGGFNPTAEALITVEDEEGNRTRMHIDDVIEFYTWYDRNGNVVHEPSSEEIDESISLVEGITEDDRINALAEYLDIEPSEISNIYNYEYETPEGDYLVVDESEAEELARDDIENFIDELGIESFTEEFRYWIENNALNTDWFEDVVAESMESYADDIENESPSDDRFENRLEEEMYEAEIIDDEDLEDGYDFDSSRFDYIEMLISNAGDPIDYCRDNFGSDWVSQAAKQHNLYDIDEIVDECIKWDGIAHFIARYDGDEIELGNGLFAYRTN